MHEILYPNNGILLCNKKEQTNDTHNDMAESQMLSQKSQIQVTIYCTILLHNIQEKIKL